jgi:Holliday junction resolvasome RuvABC endonuclease subunit|tara:strand:- start:311 stop:763 length:453 start_codon:yes stop_codon:yes gene_type:complete
MYMGIDTSTKALHVVLLNEDGSIYSQTKITNKLKDLDARIFQMSDDLYNFASIIKVTASAIEAAIFIQNPMTTIKLSAVVACAKYALHRAGLSIVPVDNRSWKKMIVGNGNAKKTDIMAHAKKVWGDVFTEQDFADSACVAEWSRRQHGS